MSLLVAILGPVLGVAGAAAVALVSRVLMTVGDLVTAAAAAGFGRRFRPAVTNPAATK
jgi:hypothetical protein